VGEAVKAGLPREYWKHAEPEIRWGAQAPDDSLRAFVEQRASLRSHVLFATSGTSGPARWVALAKTALRWSAERVNAHLGCGSEDVFCCALPTHHVGGFGILARADLAGGRVVTWDGRWSARGFAEQCREQAVTVSSLVPAQLHDLVAAGETAPPAIRVIVVGGDALPDDLADGARSLGWPVRASYGMTETGSQIATETAAGSADGGVPLIEPWEVEIDSEDRIRVRGDGLLTGYVTRVGGTWALGRAVDAQGWFRTEDLGRMTSEGRLIVEGRAGRTVKILGELVNLEFLEKRWRCASGRAGEDDVLSVRADARRGHRVVLVTAESWDEPALERARAEFDAEVRPFERIDRVLRVSALPRTELGKVRHEAVRRLVAQESG